MILKAVIVIAAWVTLAVCTAQLLQTGSAAVAAAGTELVELMAQRAARR